MRSGGRVSVVKVDAFGERGIGEDDSGTRSLALISRTAVFSDFCICFIVCFYVYIVCLPYI